MTTRIAILVFVAISFCMALPARAQANRTWVSAAGDDVHPCSRTAPCKTFASALSKTAAGGEISVLDPGGFGTVVITKSITINGDGTLAGILNYGTHGVIVNAGVDDQVILRNLSINGGGAFGTGLPNGLDGIRFLAGKALTVDNVTISNFAGRGIDMSHNANGKLFVRDSRITRGGTGIVVSTTGVTAQAQATLDNVQLTGLTNGIEASLNGVVTISGSTISGNSSNGILASKPSSQVNVEGCQISFNDLAGVNASVKGATIRLSDNEIYSNNSGITIAAGAVVETAGDNRISGNVTTAPVLGGPIPKQ